MGAVNGRLGAKPGGVATATVVARKRERGWDGNTIMWRPPRGHRDNDDVGGRGREKNWKSERSRPTGFSGWEGGRSRCGQKY